MIAFRWKFNVLRSVDSRSLIKGSIELAIVEPVGVRVSSLSYSSLAADAHCVGRNLINNYNPSMNVS